MYALRVLPSGHQPDGQREHAEVSGRQGHATEVDIARVAAGGIEDHQRADDGAKVESFLIEPLRRQNLHHDGNRTENVRAEVESPMTWPNPRKLAQLH
ncbi:MAG: hypothetical protein DME26_03090 [Verrucomicrobia bacterium]|nr:MAG: hypothetical protein DME26_03090 [Verrucomicrobiota bacterium]